jgi:hypothetical protein
VRKPSSRIAAAPMALLAAAFAAGLSSCAPAGFVDGRDRGEWKDGSGTEVAWSPKKPAIGDLVRVEASLPTGAGWELKRPGGEALAPIESEYRGGGAALRWSFRVKAAGDYGLGATVLWSVSSVAGQAAELKTRDSGELWSGRAPRSASAASPSLTPAKGAPGAAPPGAAAPAVPQANT